MMNKKLAEHITKELNKKSYTSEKSKKHELTIECNDEVWNKFQRFLCFMHYNVKIWCKECKKEVAIEI